MSWADVERYMKAAHAMQSGVAFDQSPSMGHPGSNDGSPKHLRTGINSAMVNDQAMATLLMEKGVFTLDEYQKAVADAMEAEVERYRGILKDRFGANITLA